ncbi:MAG: maleylpyruvate isomerase family mycothiol-dependent enzyme [Actinomycetota bacterium]
MDVAAALRAQVDELDGMLRGLDDAALATPSACAGWSVGDVLVHLAQTNEVAVASVEGPPERVAALWGGVGGETTVDDVAAEAVRSGPRRDGLGPYTWWKRTADDMTAAFEAVDPRARVPWVVGELAARTLCTTRLAETWIHTTDIAQGLGVTVEPTDRLWHIARLVHRTVPYASERAGFSTAPGPVRFELDAPDGAVWTFGDDTAANVVQGSAHDLCLVAGQRRPVADSGLVATGPDADQVLSSLRTFA